MVNPEEKSSLQVDCCRPMEKLIVVVGLTVHIFFSKQMPCFCSLLSGVPALYRLLQGEVGHRCFISFNLWK